jgi:ABC-type transport system involved in multi-copper enzyme maturation permease subunit
MFIEECALFRKEFALNLRGRTTFILIAEIFLLNSLVLVLMWPGADINIFQVSDRIFSYFQLASYSFLILINLFIAGMSATSFTSEKEKGTMELLQTTLISPWKFVCAKFFIFLFYVLVLFSTLIPVLALCLLGGGVSIHQILKFLAILLSTCSLNMTCAFLASISLEQSTDAIRRSYLAAFLSLGGFALVGHLLLWGAQYVYSFFDGGPALGYFAGWHFQWSTWTNPLVSLYLVLYPNLSTSAWFLEPWAINVYMYLGATVLLLPLVFYRFYQGQKVRPRLKVEEELKLKQKNTPKFIHHLTLQTSNAVLQKELCCQPYFKTRSLALSLVFMFFLMFALNYICIIREFDFALLAIVEMLSFSFVTVGIATSVITKEIEQEDFNLLRATLITPREFIVGKFRSLSYGLSTPILICCICNYLYIFGKFRINYTPLEKFVYISIYNIELLFVFYITLILSILVGVLAKKTMSATILAYLLNFLFYGGGVLMVDFTQISKSMYLLAFSPFSAITMFWTNDLSWTNIYLHIFYLGSIFGLSFLFAVQWMKQRRWVDV